MNGRFMSSLMSAVVGVICFILSSCRSINYFGRTGTVWECCSYAVISPQISHYKTYELKAFDGGKCDGMKIKYLASADSRNPSDGIKIGVVGDKVFYCDPKDGKSWKMMYDFGLQVGECAECWDYLPFPHPYYVVCTDRKQDETNSDCTIMYIAAYRNEKEYKDDLSPVLGRTDYPWVVGLGSLAGPLRPFHFMSSGIGAELLKITRGAKLIYSNEHFGIGRKVP